MSNASAGAGSTAKTSTQNKPAEPAKSENTGSANNLPKLVPGDGTEPVVVGAGDYTPANPPVVGDVPDPRLADDGFKEGNQKGYAGLDGFDLKPGAANVPYVDPANIPADVTPGVKPDAGGSELLAAAQAKAPNLTAEFVTAYKLTDQDLAAIATGAVPPPPAIGPVHTTDLYLTPGGWQQTAPGIPPGETTAISRR